ncbi:MerR family transcriptional regulator [Turicibacter sanguinis]|uniref:DNA-binding protein n=1 Tax=Turicibacter sanguinis TaxID=154288 RepID=UPI0006BFF6C1|nr:DNA-binding protein [Turicibacter sanguinis]MCU7195870.1 DNA-binding protein [Turicibacter sanguinis]CUM89793.1 Uncharacterised protein [Turicibacter sanguinis]
MGVKEKHDYPIVLNAKHVQEILGVGKTTAIKFIKEANVRLRKEGKIPPTDISTRVIISRDLFFEVYGI